MPIPYFNHNNVLPPHKSSPVNKDDISPYSCTILELCYHFSTSKIRIEILKKFILFRQRMNTFQITDGFQWVDGSFVENIEVSENRDPSDLDVVTFCRGLDPNKISDIHNKFPEFIDFNLSKQNYSVDHYPVDYCYDPDITVELTKYWLQLFTHNRIGIWKGILKLSLNTPNDDNDALNYLNSL